MITLQNINKGYIKNEIESQKHIIQQNCTTYDAQINGLNGPLLKIILVSIVLRFLNPCLQELLLCLASKQKNCKPQ